MALIPFSPPPGINSDDTTFAAEGRWADGNNVRFVNGKPQTIEGWGNFGSAAASIVAIWPVNSTQVLVGSSGGQLRFGTFASLASGVSPSPVASSTISNPTWTFGAWGSERICCYQRGKIYTQSGTSAATVVTNAPTEVNSILVSPERRQIIAFGCNEEVSGTYNARCIRWCDFEDYTDWTSLSTNNAGEFILPGPGDIVGAAWVGEYIGVWTNEGLYIGEFIGDPSETYRFRRVADGCGLMGIRLVVAVNGVAYWMAPDKSVRRWQPGTMPEPVPCPVSREMRSRISITDTPSTGFALYIPRHREVWFHYCESTSTPDRYFALCLDDGVWFKGDLARTAGVGSGILDGTISGTHLTANGTQLINQGTGFIDAGTGTWSLTLADQYIDSGNRRMLLRRFIPDFEDQEGSIRFRAYMKQYPQSTSVAFPDLVSAAYTLTDGAEKLDLRASGRVISFVFQQPASGSTFMRFGKPCVDAVVMGER